jgi:hypothetical protein
VRVRCTGMVHDDGVGSSPLSSSSLVTRGSLSSGGDDNQSASPTNIVLGKARKSTKKGNLKSSLAWLNKYDNVTSVFGGKKAIVNAQKVGGAVLLH